VKVNKTELMKKNPPQFSKWILTTYFPIKLSTQGKENILWETH